MSAVVRFKEVVATLDDGFVWSVPADAALEKQLNEAIVEYGPNEPQPYQAAAEAAAAQFAGEVVRFKRLTHVAGRVY